MIEIVAAHDVKLGMFVCELDRPWLGTPFALQGFLVSNERQLAALKEYCSFVSVDRGRSVYGEFVGEPVHRGQAAHDRGRVLLDLFKSVSMSDQRITLGAARKSPTLVSIERESAPQPSLAPLPRGSISTPQPQQAGRRSPFQGRMETVAATKKRPNLQLHRDDSSELASVVDGPPTNRFDVSRRTVYVDRTSVEEEMLASGAAFGRAQELMLDVAIELSKDKLPQPERIREAVDDLVRSMVRNPDAMIWLSKLKRSDNYSYDHSLDVSIHIMAFGRHLGYPPDQLNVLGVAGLLQDIGKTRVPLGLLQRTHPLTPAERAVLRRHVEYSTQILAAQPGIPLQVIQIAARHHERYDGSGYPRRLAGQEIGMFAEMAGLVDTYCAMSYDRPYRRGLDNQKVLHKLYVSRSKRFSEPLLIEFIQCVGLYPVGTLVELRGGEVAVVVEQNRVRRLKPRVLVLLDRDKNPLPSPIALDLKDDPVAEDGTVYQIRRTLPPGTHGIEPREFYL